MPKTELISWSRLTMPEADRHGQHQPEHLSDARIVPVDRELQAEVDPPEGPEDHQQLHERRGEDRDRIRVQLIAVFIAAVEVRAQERRAAR